MSLRKRLGLCIPLLLLLTYGTALAKGPPNKLTISGPGLSDDVEITDSQTLDSFLMGQFIDFETPIDEPSSPENGYKLTRWYRVGNTSLKAIDTFVYYPNPQGDTSYVFYEGIIDDKFILGGSPNDGKSFQITEDGDVAMRRLLGELNVTSYTHSSGLTAPTEFWKWVIRSSLLLIGGVAIYVWIFRAGSIGWLRCSWLQRTLIRLIPGRLSRSRAVR